MLNLKICFKLRKTLSTLKIDIVYGDLWVRKGVGVARVAEAGKTTTGFHGWQLYNYLDLSNSPK